MQDREVAHHSIQTTSGRSVELACPICGYTGFVASGSSSVEDHRPSFLHVIIGVSPDDTTLYQPVDFFACGDCGHILKFLRHVNEGEDGQ